MSERLRIYVPNETAAEQQFVDSLAREMSEHFGGATAFAATGSWLHEGDLWTEDVTVLEAVAFGEAVDDDLRQRLANRVKEQLGEVAVMTEVIETDAEMH
jgi:hypothetical protein